MRIEYGKCGACGRPYPLMKWARNGKRMHLVKHKESTCRLCQNNVAWEKQVEHAKEIRIKRKGI